jgi:5-formyltetrahydrofolate cyclo-ligase
MPIGPMPGIAAAAVAGGDAKPRRALRQALLERRRSLSSAELEHHSERIRALLQEAFPHFASQRVGFCWPCNNEPDLRPLIASWASAGRPGFRALLPVVLGEKLGLAFRAWSPTVAMCLDRYGIPTPATGEFLIPEALLIPVNGFDAAGYRIGYGGGYFDRTLAALCPRPLAVGVGFELARLDSIDPEPHDQPLDVMVTEAGVFRPSP